MNRKTIIGIRRGFVAVVAGLALAIVSFETAHGETAITATAPGSIEVEATQRCAGVKWLISGDDDLDCQVAVDYRQSGSSIWNAAQPLMRVEPASVSGSSVDPGNLLAGSIFGLQPGLSYDIRLTLTDPDGGTATQTISVTTRIEPLVSSNPRTRYVVPGTGGGSGTSSDPFRGLAAANAAAQAGDLFIIRPGTYTGTVNFTASGTLAQPIVWRGESVATSIFDGGGTASTVVNFPASRYVYLENVSIRAPQRRAVVGTGTEGIVLRGCTIDVYPDLVRDMEGVDFCGANQRNLSIIDCTIDGHVDWAGGRNDDSFAIRVMGKGHVIRNNVIRNWWDGTTIGCDDTSVETSGVDFYGNEVYNCTDDGIETDGSRLNLRIFNNRFTNVLCGVSCQPVYGGPIYVVKNAVYNWQLKPLKFHIWPTGIIVYNNTFVGADPEGWSGGQWRNTTVKNNLFIGGSYTGTNGDPICMDTEGVRAVMDYNGWYQARSNRFANFSSSFYSTLSAFRSGTGMEQHGVLVNIGVFIAAQEPTLGSWLGVSGFFTPYVPGSQDLRLTAGCAAVNAGTPLANINDGYSGAAPDLGAYEQGCQVPVYGPGVAPPIVAVENPAPIPGVVVFLAVEPNPFQAAATLNYEMPKAGWISLSIFDVSGRLVRSIEPRSFKAAGRYAIAWDGRDDDARAVASGTYLCRLETGGRATTQKLIRMR